MYSTLFREFCLNQFKKKKNETKQKDPRGHPTAVQVDILENLVFSGATVSKRI